MDKKDLEYLLKNNLIDEPDWYIEILNLLENLFIISNDAAYDSIEIKDLLYKLINENEKI